MYLAIKGVSASGGIYIIDFVFQQFEKFTKQHTELLIGDDVQKLPAEYVFAYKNGGFWNVMLTWIENDAMLSPDEIALIISKI